MIEKSVLLPCGPGAAFTLFTARINEWWPESHRPSKDPASRLFLEESGRFFERAADGREFDLGRVVDWRPADRLELDFYLGTGPFQPTAVTIEFVPEGEGTRVIVRHRAKPESAGVWDLRATTFDRSWLAVLDVLLRAAQSVTNLLH